MDSRPGPARQPDRASAGRLTFRPGDDAEFVELFAQTAPKSLDVMTRRGLAMMDAHELAREELDYCRSCPGESDWWQVATSEEGVVVGFVIPSATPSNRNVGLPVAFCPAIAGMATSTSSSSS